jgi:gliding motility-associated-like protein
MYLKKLFIKSTMRKIFVIVFAFFVLSQNAFSQDDTLNGAAACNAAAVSGTWTVPCGVTSITVEVYGGGGSGGGGGGGSMGGACPTIGGGGGGGGGFTTITINVLQGAVFNYSVGSGACGGSNGGDTSNGGHGNAGGNSSFSGTDALGTAINLLANGGARGNRGNTCGIFGNGNPGTGGAGGTASGGSTNTTGLSGGNGVVRTGSMPSNIVGGTGGDGAGPLGGSGGLETNNSGSNFGGGGAGGGDSPGGRGAVGAILIYFNNVQAGIPTPIIATTSASCTAVGTATITNFISTATYTFLPTGPTVGAGGLINGMTPDTSYTVIANDGGCISDPSVAFQINGPPVYGISVFNNGPYCEFDNTFIGTNVNTLPIGVNYVFNWFGPNNFTSNLPEIINAQDSGLYHLVLTADGCVQDTVSTNLVIFQQPEAVISNDSNYCSTDAIVLNSTILTAGTPSFNWTGPNNFTSSIQNPTNAVDSGLYNLLVIINGCSSVVYSTQVGFYPDENASFNYSSANYCQSEPNPIANIQGTQGGIFTINNGGTINSSTGEIDFDNTNPGNYTVTYNTNGNCPQTSTQNITILEAPNPPIFEADTFCLDVDDVILVNTNPNSVYTWMDNAGNILFVGNNFDLNIDSAGVYDFCVAQTVNSCISDTSCFNIFVGNPIANFDLLIDEGNAPFAPSITNSSSDASIYTWEFGDGGLSSQTVPDYIYQDSGVFTIVLIASDEFNCSTTASQSINILPRIEFIIPNVFSPNNDGKNDTFKIQGSQMKAVKGQIFNRFGMLIYEWDLINLAWDGRTQAGVIVPEGTYFYIINIEDVTGEVKDYTGSIQLVR